MCEKWFALIVGINQEFLAEGGLKAKGFETYVPIGQKVVRHARQEMVKRYPVFSRYLFIRFDTDRHSSYALIRSTGGVVDILCNNSEPMAIDNLIIEEIKERQSSGDFDRFPEKPKKQYRWSRSFEVLRNLLNTEVVLS